MRKIPTLFIRDENNLSQVTTQVNPECQWVIEGKGIATRKYDGTACLIKDGKFYKRYDCKRGKQPPPGFMPAQEPDPITGHWPGWVEVSNTAPDDKYHIEAYAKLLAQTQKQDEELALYDAIVDLTGTYELCGPKIQANPEKLSEHSLIRHGCWILTDVPTDFDGLKQYLSDKDIEGIVWHAEDAKDDIDCKMAKIKKRDFGFKR